MEVILNGSPLDVEGVDESATVGELVSMVEEGLKGSERTIVEILLDGKDYFPEDDVLDSLKLLSYDRIELSAESVSEMVQDGVADTAEGLVYMHDLSEEIASELRVGNVKDAMAEYVNFVDGIEWVMTMFSNADRAFASDMAESSLEQERENLLGRLKEQMASLETAQAQENWVEAADILEYEFSEIFDDVGSFADKLISERSSKQK